MTWRLFLDDVRPMPETLTGPWVLARSSEEAKILVRSLGMPEMMSLDHDLGNDDTVMVFLKWLANEYWDGTSPVPSYRVHSANPVGAQNIVAFLDSWERVQTGRA